MTRTIMHEEKVLLQAAALGDGNAFEKIYEFYRASILKFTISFLKSPDLSEDVTQEIFIKIWDNRATLGKVQSFKDYLFISARNHIFSVLKKQARETDFKSLLLNNYKQEPFTAEDQLIDKDYSAFINQVLQSLSPQTRQVFQLCRNQNKSYDEVAELLGISRNTVKKHMVRSHKAFTESINNNPDIILSALGFLFFETLLNNF